MSEINHPNPHLVELGDVYEDLDKGRPERRLKVVAISNGRAHLLNLKTNRTSMVALARLTRRSKGSHGYLRVERAPRPDGLERPNDRTPADMLHPSPGLELVGFGFRKTAS